LQKKHWLRAVADLDLRMGPTALSNIQIQISFSSRVYGCKIVVFNRVNRSDQFFNHALIAFYRTL